MENSDEHADKSLPLSKVVRIDQICDQFDRAINASIQNRAPWPSIENYLGDTTEPVRSQLRKELLAVETSYRRQHAEGGNPDPPSESSPETRLWQPGEPESRQTGDDTTSEQREPAPEASVGHPARIGRYRIKRVLGKGAFGTVYQGYDDELKRHVAIKVPHCHLVDKPEDIELYLEEAQVVASLDHANIVPVHDVGQTADGLCYVVSKFIDGSDLAKRMKQERFAHRVSAELVMTIAKALDHAHRHMVVHRDVKPANILIDASGKPFLADFGLALKEEDFGTGAGGVGTPAYMSPEQARGEGHLVDGRADIFSLGVVLYELLADKRPFWAANRAETIDRIRYLDVRPLRQIDDSIARELERICLKALAKRPSERYATAMDMADDLRHYLAQSNEAGRSAEDSTGETPPIASEATGAAKAGLDSTDPANARNPVKIVPKGLRSFDCHDADFFMELLPGPRDRDGLPESIRFWKHRIEETDADKTFRVGVIYGPSGCGKSSLVKAGLLPRLSPSVTSIYVEASVDDAETCLLQALRKQCPGLAENLGLTQSLAVVRRGRAIAPEKKVLIVLDQFEQWLHSRSTYENLELLEALRQCDGEHVQCVVLVRDDFWLAVSRFMLELEVALVSGRNVALVDLFDVDHARKVLNLFGSAYARLAENPSAISQEQSEFLKLATSSLTRESKVICVRLALFAEMMKGRPWTPAELKAVGGTEGVGLTFLEETFSSQAANPRHRYHQKAVRAVLNRLLPEAGADIKGSMRSYSELLEASGYGSRPKDFEEVIRILDNEIRLITPTDPEGKEEAVAGSVRPGGNYYQLTHDYLVHSIRDWLTRKQKETRRGRAELALADRAAVWNARLENRQLPSLLQWLQIRWLTYEKDWTPPQRRMMQKAGRKYAIRAGLAVAVIVLLTIGIREVNGRFQAASLVEQLANADTTQVPMIIDKLNRYRQWADPELNKEFDHAEADSPGKLHSALALLPSDESKTDFLRDRLLVATPQQFRIVRDQLSPRNVALIEPLWGIALNSKQPIHTRFQAACALAAYAPNDNRWKRICSLIAGHLVTLQAEDFSAFRQSLVPVKDQLLDPLISLYEQKSGREQSRLYAAEALALYAADDPKVLANLLMDADEQQFAIIFRKVENQGDRSKPHLLSELGKQIRPVQPIWNLRFFKWESNQRPLPADWRELTPPTDWNKVIGSPILDAVQTSHLSFFSWQLPQSTPTANILRARSTPTAKVPGEFFAAAATTEVELDESEYVITVVFDDGVRVWFDNEKVFENWNTNPTTRRAISIGRRKGKHRIQVDYLQIIGNYVLDFALVPTDETKESLVKRKANAAIGLLRTNQEQVVWPLLKQSPDPGVRSLLVHRLGLLGADAQAVIDQLDKESEISIRRALVLSLGGFGDVALPPEQRTILLPKFQAMYRTENDPGLHAAVEWLLKKWKQDAWVNETTQKLADDRGNRFMRLSEIRGLVSRTQEKAPPQWYVNGQGQTMVVIPGPVNFLMGAPPSEFGRSTNRFDESLHEQRIGHSYAIADKPVTIAQYYRFPRHQFLSPEFSTSKDCPANGLVWNNAALYCNWLSLVEGEPESEWCYEPNREGFFDEGMKVVPDYLNRRGYRLPTEAEWEYACRAGTMTTTYYGDSKDLMPMYSLNSMYAGRSSWPAGILKPNDFGLFDMLGNVTNVCQNLCEPHSDGVGWQITEDSGNGFMLSKNSLFPIRGAAWGMIQPPNYRCAANRLSGTTGNAQGSGFRVARTIK